MPKWESSALDSIGWLVQSFEYVTVALALNAPGLDTLLRLDMLLLRLSLDKDLCSDIP